MTDLICELQRSFQRLCDDFEQRMFYPDSENDITSYLYYSLVAQEGIDKDFVHTEYTLRNRGRRYRADMVIGRPLSRTWEDVKDSSVRLPVEIKLWKGSLAYYLDHVRYHGRSLVEEDLKKLVGIRHWYEQMRNPAIRDIALVLFFRKLPPYTRETPELLQTWNDLSGRLIKIRDELDSEDVRLLIGPRCRSLDWVNSTSGNLHSSQQNHASRD